MDGEISVNQCNLPISKSKKTMGEIGENHVIPHGPWPNQLHQAAVDELHSLLPRQLPWKI